MAINREASAVVEKRRGGRLKQEGKDRSAGWLRKGSKGRERLGKGPGCLSFPLQWSSSRPAATATAADPRPAPVDPKRVPSGGVLVVGVDPMERRPLVL